jgi:tRNA-splicing ligase RtcB
MKIIDGGEGSVVIKSWCDNLEEGAIEQAKNLSRLPFAFRQVCIMADGHLGYGMPIGGVLATKGVVIPNCVGVDISCGMVAVKTSLTEIPLELLKKIMGEIRKAIPVGFNKHKEPQDESLMPAGGRALFSEANYNNAMHSLGSLGGGNHFVEVQKGNDGHIWIMIHSGSRNLGKQVADFHNKVAIELNERYHSKVPTEWELAFLPIDSNEGQAYLKQMNYCVDFSFANRKLMMDRIMRIFCNVVGEVLFDPMINISHNYARLESHWGSNVMVHRKGATFAGEGTTCLIPGSQGTASYIARGLGNRESFSSCSHGAGRRMGRKEAQRTLNLEEEQKKLDDQGILHAIRGRDDLDEASGAYKDISTVMKEQEDLVEILVELRPLAVVKG